MSSRNRIGSGWLSRARVVFHKEWTDNLRDRRSILSALAYSLFGPLLVAWMVQALADDPAQRRIEVPTVGIENAQGLAEALATRPGAELVAAPTADQSELKEAVRSGDLDLVLVVDEGYTSRYRDLRPATLHLIVDSSRTDSVRAAARLRYELTRWSTEVASFRLTARGVDPGVARPFQLDTADVATPQAKSLRVLGGLPIFFLLAAFIGGMNVAIDVTAGERERRSMESLLVHAVPASALAVGKWLAAVVFATASLAVMLALSVVALGGAAQAAGLPLRFGTPEAVRIFVVLLPLALLAPALQMALAIFARSFKEAQTQLSLLLFVPMVPGFLLMLDRLRVTPLLHAIPAVGQQVQMLEILRGASPSPDLVALCVVTTVLVTGLCVGMVARWLRREALVLGL